MKDRIMTLPKPEGGNTKGLESQGPLDETLESSKETCEDLESMRRLEGLLARRSFALDVFFENGGQNLLEEFGAERVFKSLQDINARSRAEKKPLPDLYDLLVALEADRKKRVEIISSIRSKIKVRLEELSDFYSGKRLETPSRHRNYTWSSVSLQDAAMQELKIRDLPVVGKMLSQKGSLLPRATEGMQIYFIEQNALAELMDELNSQDDHADVLAAAEFYYEKSRDLAEGRVREAREKAIPLTERIQEITATAWAEFGEKVLGMLGPYAHLDETDEANPFQTRVKQVVVDAIQKEVDELEAATVSRIERETDPYRKMLKKIELAGSASCLP